MNLEPLKEKIRFVKRHYFPEMVALVVIFGAVGAFASLYAGQRSNLPIPYQGKLLDSNSVPVADGTYYLKFAIYDASSAGNCLWQTEQPGSGVGCSGTTTSTPVTVNRGVFTVYLGNGDSTNDEITSSITNNFNSGTYWLGITSCGTNNSCDSEMTPRRQFGGVPYAFNADFLDGVDSTSFISAGGTLTHTGTSTDALTISAASLTTGSGLIVTGPSGAGITDSLIKASSTLDVFNNGGLMSLAATINSTSSPGSATNLYLSTTNSNSTTSNTAYGLYNTLSDSTALGNSLYGSYISLSHNATPASGGINKAGYGEYISVSVTGASSTGVSDAYGLYISANATHSVDYGTANSYGLYIANSAGNGSGTSTKYGIYVDTQTGADLNYGAIFASNVVGIGTTTPLYMLDIATSTSGATADLLRLQNSAAAATSSASELLFSANRLITGMTNLAGIGGIVTNIGNTTYTGELIFSTANSAAIAERMRIMGSGNVGIGTTTPQDGLHVVADNGHIRATNLNLDPGSNDPVIYFNGTYLGPNDNYIDSDSAFQIWHFPTDDILRFRATPPGTAGGVITWNEGIVLNTIGNVGIGTTTPWTAFNATNTTSTILTIGSLASKRGILTLAGETAGLLTIQPASNTTSWSLTLPSSAPSSDGQVLTADGTTGATKWAAGGSGALTFLGTATGTATSIQNVTTTIATSSYTTAFTDSDTLLVYYSVLSGSGGGGVPIGFYLSNDSIMVGCTQGLTGGSCSNLPANSNVGGVMFFRKQDPASGTDAIEGGGNDPVQGIATTTWSVWNSGTRNLEFTVPASVNTNTFTVRMSLYKLAGQ